MVRRGSVASNHRVRVVESYRLDSCVARQPCRSASRLKLDHVLRGALRTMMHTSGFQYITTRLSVDETRNVQRSHVLQSSLMHWSQFLVRCSSIDSQRSSAYGGGGGTAEHFKSWSRLRVSCTITACGCSQIDLAPDVGKQWQRMFEPVEQWSVRTLTALNSMQRLSSQSLLLQRLDRGWRRQETSAMLLAETPLVECGTRGEVGASNAVLHALAPHCVAAHSGGNRLCRSAIDDVQDVAKRTRGRSRPVDDHPRRTVDTQVHQLALGIARPARRHCSQHVQRGRNVHLRQNDDDAASNCNNPWG
jgi:hypothetical protein